jgi:hypothetical protein
MEQENVFNKLVKINIDNYLEEKDGLKYLSWSHAWCELKKMYHNSNYKVLTFGENNLPYIYDNNTGYMIFTEVTVEGITHGMWLPVMDSKNKSMKKEQYKYSTKYGEKTVEAATMFDINKTIMRCLVKNIAMFGLGINVYNGEDFCDDKEHDDITIVSKNKNEKEGVQDKLETKKTPKPKDNGTQTKHPAQKFLEDMKSTGKKFSITDIAKKYSKRSLTDLTEDEMNLERKEYGLL